MKGVQESLAGRLALFHLSPLSQQEIYPVFEPDTYKNDYQLLLKKQKKTSAFNNAALNSTPLTGINIYERIFRGSMPALVSGKFSDRRPRERRS